jgi:hypothetical protein
MSRWKWVRHEGNVYRDVGVDEDGSVLVAQEPQDKP